MKKSIAYLPKKHQNNLYYLVTKIVKNIPQTQMIILYGSYARNDYVEYDERVEFGIPTSYMSDYDILVVTHGTTNREAMTRLYTIADNFCKGSEYQPPVQFITETIENLNRDLSDGKYFYTELKQDGIMIYDSGKHKLARRRKLRFDEIKQQAERYFEEKKYRASEFSIDANNSYARCNYNLSSFYLHQVCENLFHATRLVYTLNSGKQHNLVLLLGSVRKYSEGFYEMFSTQTTEEERLFDLLAAAYIEGRYNPDFEVTKEDIEALMVKAQQLFNLVERICKEQIAKYDALGNEE